MAEPLAPAKGGHAGIDDVHAVEAGRDESEEEAVGGRALVHDRISVTGSEPFARMDMNCKGSSKNGFKQNSNT